MLVKHYQTLLDATCLTRLNSTVKHVGLCWTICWTICWMKFDFVQTFHPTSIVQQFRLRDQKYAITSCLVLKSNIIGWCWNCLNTPASNTNQHWSNTVQHHQTMLDNVWPTCFIRLNRTGLYHYHYHYYYHYHYDYHYHSNDRDHDHDRDRDRDHENDHDNNNNRDCAATVTVTVTLIMTLTIAIGIGITITITIIIIVTYRLPLCTSYDQ